MERGHLRFGTSSDFISDYAIDAFMEYCSRNRLSPKGYKISDKKEIDFLKSYKPKA